MAAGTVVAKHRGFVHGRSLNADIYEATACTDEIAILANLCAGLPAIVSGFLACKAASGPRLVVRKCVLVLAPFRSSASSEVSDVRCPSFAGCAVLGSARCLGGGARPRRLHTCHSGCKWLTVAPFAHLGLRGRWAADTGASVPHLLIAVGHAPRAVREAGAAVCRGHILAEQRMCLAPSAAFTPEVLRSLRRVGFGG